MAALILEFPIVFDQEELESFYEGRRKFSLSRMETRLIEKILQVVLSAWYSVRTREPGEIYGHARVVDFHQTKVRKIYGDYRRISIAYTIRGETWRHVFHFVRNTQGGVTGGTLISKSRKSLGN